MVKRNRPPKQTDHMRDRRKAAKRGMRVVTASDLPRVPREVPGKAELARAASEVPVLFVAPPITEVIRDIAAVTAKEIQCMRLDASTGARLSTDGAVKLRNLVSSMEHAQEMQLKAVQDTPLVDIPTDELVALRDDIDDELARRATRAVAGSAGDVGEEPLEA